MANDNGKDKNSENTRKPGIFGTTPIWNKDNDSDKKQNSNPWGGSSRDSDDD